MNGSAANWTPALGRTATILAVVALMMLSACSLGAFSIQGTWKSTGETGWGQAQPGRLVQFSKSKANLWSPADTYALTKDGDGYLLEVTGLLNDTHSLKVVVVDNDNIELRQGSSATPKAKLTRVG